MNTHWVIITKKYGCMGRVFFTFKSLTAIFEPTPHQDTLYMHLLIWDKYVGLFDKNIMQNYTTQLYMYKYQQNSVKSWNGKGNDSFVVSHDQIRFCV